MKLKPTVLYGIKPKNEDWIYIPDDLFPTRKDALRRKKDYTNQSEMKVVKLKLIEIK